MAPAQRITFLLAASLGATVSAGAIAANTPDERRELAEPTLGGPNVGPEAGGADQQTLVVRTYDGELRPLETLPEIAAAELIDLDDKTRKLVDDAILAYNRAFDEFVVGHVAELMSVETWFKTGQWLPVIQLVEDLRLTLESAVGKGGLAGRIERTLPADLAGEYRSLLDEYEHAKRTEARAKAAKVGERFDVVGYRMARQFERIELSLTSAFDRIVDSGVYFAEEIFKRVDLSEASKTRVRAVVQQHVTMWDGREPTTQEQIRLGWDVVAAVEGKEKGAILKAILNMDEQ